MNIERVLISYSSCFHALCHELFVIVFPTRGQRVLFDFNSSPEILGIDIFSSGLKPPVAESML